MANQTLTCAAANSHDLVDYLSHLGYEPQKVSGHQYWYCSPLRDETHPSFKVDRSLNLWYDHGLGQGGTLVDFGIRYHRCSVSEFLQKIDNKLIQERPTLRVGKVAEPDSEPTLKIVHERPLQSLSLQRYLYQRRISLNIASQYCKEVGFELHGKPQLAIGFPNRSGGYELRNAWFKGSSAPKDITLVHNDAETLSVFEGFFDFLSFASIHQKQALPATNFLILNSTSLLEKNRPLLEQHQRIHLYLDRDTTGQRWTQAALYWSSRYRDESTLYRNYKDLNDWVQHIGKSQKQALRPTIH